jgi:chromosome segregation ATPase
MKKNSVTLLAEIDEEQEDPVDSAMATYHGLVFRRLRKETENDQLTREISLSTEELDQLNAALSNADNDTKKKINKEIRETTKKLKILEKRTHTKLTDAKKEYHQKEAALNDQLNNAKESKQAKIIKRREALKDEYEARYTKLKEASETAEEAL